MEDPARLGRMRSLASLAALLRRVAEAPEADRPRRFLVFAYASDCHAALSPRLPRVEATG